MTDYDGFSQFAKRARAFVQDNEPATLAWECFADEASGRGFFQESSTNQQAFLTHFQNMVDHGFVEEIMPVFEPQTVRILCEITDPRVTEIATQFGAVQLHDHGGLSR